MGEFGCCRSGLNCFCCWKLQKEHLSNLASVLVDSRSTCPMTNSNCICAFVLQLTPRLREEEWRPRACSSVFLFCWYQTNTLSKEYNFLHHLASFLCAAINKQWKSNEVVLDYYFPKMCCHFEESVDSVKMPVFSLLSHLNRGLLVLYGFINDKNHLPSYELWIISLQNNLYDYTNSK